MCPLFITIILIVTHHLFPYQGLNTNLAYFRMNANQHTLIKIPHLANKTSEHDLEAYSELLKSQFEMSAPSLTETIMEPY